MFSEFSPTCCEGLASEATADQACADQCQQIACSAARSVHLDFAEDIGGITVCNDFLDANPSCGFDMDACLAGTWHKQTIQFAASHADYWMKVQCFNARTNETFTDDVFNWNQRPVNTAPEDDPPMCNGAVPAANNPGLVYSDNVATEAPATTAVVAWTFSGSDYREDTQDAALRFAYDLQPCATNARCLDLAELQVTIPPMTVQGVSIENGHLQVYRTDSRPQLQSNGTFSYAPGTIHAIISASASGVPISLKGSNSGTTTGLLAPGSDTMTLSGLVFDYSDSLIAAQLQLDIVGDYTLRGPTAVIVPADVPRACADPVSFRAASSDPDAQSLSHFWWVPGVLIETGSTLDLALANGTHTIGLLARDADGRLDASAIQYTRSCL